MGGNFVSALLQPSWTLCVYGGLRRARSVCVSLSAFSLDLWRLAHFIQCDLAVGNYILTSDDAFRKTRVSLLRYDSPRTVFRSGLQLSFAYPLSFPDSSRAPPSSDTHMCAKPHLDESASQPDGSRLQPSTSYWKYIVINIFNRCLQKKH